MNNELCESGMEKFIEPYVLEYMPESYSSLLSIVVRLLRSREREGDILSPDCASLVRGYDCVASSKPP